MIKYIFFIGLAFAIIYIAIVSINILLKIQTSKTLIAKAEPYTQSAEPGGQKILILGDSTALGVGSRLPEETIAGRLGLLFATAEVQNISKSGLKTVELIPLIENIPADNTFDLIVLQIGGNDIVYFTNYKQLEADIETVVTLAKERGNRVMLMHSGNVGSAPLFSWPLDSIMTKRTLGVRKIFQQIAQEHNVTYIDLYREPENDLFVQEPQKYFADDDFHPSGNGYGLWFETLKVSLGI